MSMRTGGGTGTQEPSLPGYTVYATPPGGGSGEHIEVVTDSRGVFTIDAVPGDWEVSIELADGDTLGQSTVRLVRTDTDREGPGSGESDYAFGVVVGGATAPSPTDEPSPTTGASPTDPSPTSAGADPSPSDGAPQRPSIVQTDSGASVISPAVWGAGIALGGAVLALALGGLRGARRH